MTGLWRAEETRGQTSAKRADGERHAATNGMIIRHGYIAAEFGDTKAVDPIYSAAKSFLSTVCGLAVAQGLIRDVNDPVAKYIHDGGYDSPHNRKDGK